MVLEYNIYTYPYEKCIAVDWIIEKHITSSPFDYIPGNVYIYMYLQLMVRPKEYYQEAPIISVTNYKCGKNPRIKINTSLYHKLRRGDFLFVI